MKTLNKRVLCALFKMPSWIMNHLNHQLHGGNFYFQIGTILEWNLKRDRIGATLGMNTCLIQKKLVLKSS